MKRTNNYRMSLYQFTPRLILLRLKKVQLLCVLKVSHSYLNACEALGVRPFNTRSLQLNKSGALLLWKKEAS